MQAAPFGITGFETAFPLLYSEFVQSGKWSLAQLISWLTDKPADTFGLAYGRLETGAAADLVLLDLDRKQAISPETFVSRVKNTPFAGKEATGWPVLTIFGGEIVFKGEEAWSAI